MGANLWKLTLVVLMTHGFRELSRRLGPRRAGLALGLPCSTAVALIGEGSEQGIGEALTMAGSCQLGLAGSVALPLAYLAAIRRGATAGTASALAILAYLLASGAVGGLDPSSVGLGLGVSSASILVAMMLMGRAGPYHAGDRRDPSKPAMARTLAVRSLVPVACLAASQAIGRAFGPEGAGLMIAFPGLTLTTLGLTHLESGPGAASRMARALPVGNLGMVAFLTLFRLGGSRLGLGGGLALGYLAAVAFLAVLAMPEARGGRVRRRVAAWSEAVAALADRGRALPGGPRPGKRFSPIFEVVAP